MTLLRMLCIAFAATILSSSPAFSANWFVIAVIDESESTVSVDTSGIARTGKLRKAWFKWHYTDPKPIPRGAGKADEADTEYYESLELDYFDCNERTWANVQAIYRSSKGRVVATLEYDEHERKFLEAAPETISEVMVSFVCGWPLDKKP